MNTYDSNMASEFLVMSILYRLGLAPILTLGNKKEIDIVVHDKSRFITIDVKGLKSTTCWPIGNSEKLQRYNSLSNHFFVFVTYKNKFSLINEIPEIYIVPSNKVSEIADEWRGQDQYVVYCKTLRQRQNDFLDKWKLLTCKHDCL